MKRYNNLWEKICNFENFRLAYNNATKGKKHYREVKEIERIGVDECVRGLLDEVVNFKYRVSKYEIFKRVTGGKEREIYKLPMRDRIVQHAIMNIIEPIFRENFIVDTYSSIKYRGIHRGLRRLKKAMRDNNYEYYLKLDIHKCYPSINQDILKRKLQKKFKDKRLLNLLYIIIDSCDNGVPIGNYTSQYFNNFYFSSLDHWIKEQKRVKHYYRYCDDMIILGHDKQYLHQLLYEINKQVEQLGVHLKQNYQLYKIDKKGIDFLGFKTWSSHVLVRKVTKHNFINKCKRIDFNELSTKDVNVLGSYWGIKVHCNARHLWTKYSTKGF